MGTLCWRLPASTRPVWIAASAGALAGAAVGRKGQRSPRVNVAITPDQDSALKGLASPGVKRSEAVRQALDQFLAAS